MWGKSSVSPLPPPSPPTSLDYKSEPKLSSSLPSALREKCLSKSHFVDNWIISPVKWGWLGLSVVNIVVNMFCLSLLTVQLEHNPSLPSLPSSLLSSSVIQLNLFKSLCMAWKLRLNRLCIINTISGPSATRLCQSPPLAGEISNELCCVCLVEMFPNYSHCVDQKRLMVRPDWSLIIDKSEPANNQIHQSSPHLHPKSHTCDYIPSWPRVIASLSRRATIKLVFNCLDCQLKHLWLLQW